MALALPNSIFFHAGRTAGHYVRKVIREMEIPTYEIGQFHDWPSNIKLDASEKSKIHFCFVRHPLEWLRSYWCHEMQFGWSTNEYAEKLKSDKFSEFLEKAIEAYPNGPVSEAFAPFISQCHEIGRQENLESDLLNILTKAKENVRPSVIAKAGVISVEIDPEIRKFATAPKEILEKVMEVESKFCARWGYENIPPSMIGPSQTCLAPYVPLKASEKHHVKDADFVSGNTNAFVLNEVCVPGIRETRRTTMLIKRVLEDLELENKEVIDVASADGVFSFYAEARGASRVVGVSLGMPIATVETIKNTLESKVDFHNTGLYGFENVIGGKFDVAFCFRMLELLRYPFLAIRTISRLMKEGGTLVLECGYLNAFNGIPLMYVPVGSESPTLSRECTFFNKGSLMNTLSTYGFYDFKIHYEFTRGVDKARDFSNIQIASNEIFHDSDSVVGRILLSCRWSSAQIDQDPRYLIDGLSGRYLLDYWDSQLPETGIPEYRPTAETLEYLREQVSSHNELSTQLQQALASVKSAIQDRESALAETREALVERTALLEQANKDIQERTQDLVETRQLLLERTVWLEQNNACLLDKAREMVELQQVLADRTEQLERVSKDLVDRTQELVETRQVLVDRTKQLEQSGKD